MLKMVQKLTFATKYELLHQTHFVNALLPAILLKGRNAIAPTIMVRNRMICIVGLMNICCSLKVQRAWSAVKHGNNPSWSWNESKQR